MSKVLELVFKVMIFLKSLKFKLSKVHGHDMIKYLGDDAICNGSYCKQFELFFYHSLKVENSCTL